MSGQDCQWDDATLDADESSALNRKTTDSGYESRRIVSRGGSGGAPLLPKLDKPPPPQN
jgi:hypothetical protein